MAARLLEKKVFSAKITSKAQIVIPRPIRDAYGLREGGTVRLIATEEGILLKPSIEKPWAGLRGMMRKEWSSTDLDSLIEEAKKFVLKRFGAK